MNPFLMITGATGGLGSAFVLECARRGYDLYLTDRHPDGTRLAEFIAQTYTVRVVYRACDLEREDARAELFQSLKSEGYRFWGLINVAGTDTEGAFLEVTRRQILRILQVNLEAAVDVTHEVLALRDPERTFRLITVCSLAAFFPMPYKATYAASKRFLLDFTRAIGEEIRDFGSATALCPAGLPTTPATMQAIFAQGFWGRMTTVDTRSVARRTMNAALRGRRVYVPGWLNAVIQWLGPALPAWLALRFVRRRWQAAQQERSSWSALQSLLEPGWSAAAELDQPRHSTG